MARQPPRVIFVGLLVILATTLLSAKVGATSITATITLGLCGDGSIGSGEQCDGSALGGASCTSRGFTGGTLSCSASCEFNTSACTSTTATPAPSSDGGGGGGGGSIAPVTPVTGVVFSGRAYPKTTVTLLKDAQVAATTLAGADAKFQINVSGLSGGNYNFSVYSEDNKGIRSSLLTFPVSVTSGVTTNVGGIFIAPTIAVDKSEVKQGDTIVIFGQSTPASEITISISSENESFVKKTTDASGVYLLNFDTSVLDLGQHNAKSKVALGGEISSFSKTVGFTVGTKNVLAQAQSVTKGDSNNDKRVNLIDFSILAYWFNRPLTPVATALVDLNGDKKVNLVDFSIMAYYWTG